MNDKKRNRIAILAAPAILCILMLANGASAARAAVYVTHSSSHTLDLGTPATFAGSASVLSINTPLTSFSFGGSGPLDPTGGWVSGPMSEVQTDVADAEMLTSVAMGSGQQAESEAAIGNLVLLPGTAYQVTSDFSMSRAFATCDGVFGDAAVENLQVAGQTIAVTGDPNQAVDIPGLATLVINEQSPDPSGTGIFVNALDLITADGIEILVNSAYSSISCPTSIGLGVSQLVIGSSHFQPMHGVPLGPSCFDFTTGGGWITPPPPFSGGKSTFGFVAGYKPGGTNPRGEVEYHDHTSGQFNIHSLDVLYYACGPDNNPNSRVFGGDAELNHVSGYCYEVYIQDNGEPGVGTDYLDMFLWPPGTPCGSPPTGFTETYANGNFLGGGNIVIHQ